MRRPSKAWMLALPLVLAGCVPNQAWRIHYTPNNPPVIDPPLFRTVSTKCHGANVNSSYYLAFIEFDDRGEFFERGQLEQALRLISQVKSHATDTVPATVVLFVHGWKNNASEQSGNVAGFESMLGCLASQFNSSPAPEASTVVGIYLGWRGRVVSAPGIEDLTFWNRRNESRNLPGAHTVETLLSVMKAIKGPDYSDPKGQSFLIGHSFGGGLLETALTQTYENIILNTPSGSPVHWPTDLTVLINEAAPALQAYQLIESMKANVRERPACGAARGESHYLPAMISLTSVTDSATGGFFPFGQAISRPFQSLRHYPHPNAVGVTDQESMYLKTTAHLQQFISHVLDTSTSAAVQSAASAGCLSALTSAGIAHATYKLVERPGSVNLSPYWVAQIPTLIVPDHSQVFGEEFRDLMTDLVLGQKLPGISPYIRR